MPDVDPYGDLNTELERTLGKIVKDKYGTDFYILHRYPMAVSVCPRILDASLVLGLSRQAQLTAWQSGLAWPGVGGGSLHGQGASGVAFVHSQTPQRLRAFGALCVLTCCLLAHACVCVCACPAAADPAVLHHALS